MKNQFEIIILLGRPASGKSEIIDFLKKTPAEKRKSQFHIGEFEEIDDFPMLWTWFEEDAILEKIMNKPRLHSDKEGYFLYEHQWNLLIERISLEYKKKMREHNYTDKTTIIEFSRGSEHGGYKSAFQHLSDEILAKACILYVDVTFEESLRKNRRRFNPDRPDSILEHGLPDEKLEKMYGKIDWEEVSSTDPEFIDIRGFKVPYIVLKNMPEVTDDVKKLEPALENTLNGLWKIHKKAKD